MGHEEAKVILELLIVCEARGLQQYIETMVSDAEWSDQIKVRALKLMPETQKLLCEKLQELQESLERK